MLRTRADSANRRHVDEARATLEVRDDSSRDVEHALEIDTDELIPVLVRRLLERDAGRVYAGAVKDVVDRAESLERLVDKVGDFLNGGDVDVFEVGCLRSAFAELRGRGECIVIHVAESQSGV